MLTAPKPPSLRGRLLGLLGLAVIVGGAIGILFAFDLIGGESGGTTSSGVPIRDAALLPPVEPTDIEIGPRPGQLAPEFEASRMDNGERVRLSDFRGRPVYVNFWASWCVPCLVEMRDIDQLAATHPDLVVVGINRGESVRVAEGFLEKITLKDGSSGFSFTVGLMDPSQTLYRAYLGLGMPVSIFIDAQGQVVAVWNGLLSPSRMEQFYQEAVAG